MSTSTTSYPDVKVQQSGDGSFHITVQRADYLKTEFQLYEQELGPVIDELINTKADME